MKLPRILKRCSFVLLGCLLAYPLGVRAQHVHDHSSHAAEGGVRPQASSAAAEIEMARQMVRLRAEAGAIRTLRVGASWEYETIHDAVLESGSGDTIRVSSGVYRERISIPHTLVLLGEPGATLDGEGEGTVLQIDLAPESVIRGMTVRGSGRNLSREDSGLLVSKSPGIRIESCAFEDVLFGVYLKESAGASVSENEIEGYDTPISSRGDAIRLWYSADGVVERNRVRRSRDVVVWFSDDVEVRDNEVTKSRYGIHYMYSDRGRFDRNRFTENLVGGFLMYSRDVQFSRNVFAASRGATGMGLGLKDTDEIHAQDNVIVGNAVGVYLDNSPQSVGAKNLFRRNHVLMNRTGVSLMPSVKGNEFEANAFDGNVREVTVSGGGDALANRWEGNYWSRYAGFDRDRDGVGDASFMSSRLSDQLLVRNPQLELFALSPAASVLDVLARVLPFLEPAPVVIDEMPLSRVASTSGIPETEGWSVAARSGRWLGAVTAWAILAVTAGVGWAGYGGRQIVRWESKGRASRGAGGAS